MINLDWITSPLTIYGVLSAGGSAALYLVVSTRIDLRRQETRHLAESQSLRETVQSLEGKVQQMRLEIKENRLPQAAISPLAGINLHKRAEALRMYRHGSNSHAVSQTLGMPQAEVVLLEKVQRLLNGETAA